MRQFMLAASVCTICAPRAQSR